MSQTWQPKDFYGSAQPVGKLTDIYRTAYTMPGYPTAPGNRCDRLSKGYRCSCINSASTTERMMYREMGARASPLSPTEKTDHAKSRACPCEKYEEDAKND